MKLCANCGKEVKAEDLYPDDDRAIFCKRCANKIWWT